MQGVKQLLTILGNVGDEPEGCENYKVIKMVKNTTIYEMASYLYDGGWRADDVDQMIREYGLSLDVGCAIASALGEIERDQ